MMSWAWSFVSMADFPKSNTGCQLLTALITTSQLRPGKCLSTVNFPPFPLSLGGESHLDDCQPEIRLMCLNRWSGPRSLFDYFIELLLETYSFKTDFETKLLLEIPSSPRFYGGNLTCILTLFMWITEQVRDECLISMWFFFPLLVCSLAHIFMD